MSLQDLLRQALDELDSPVPETWDPSGQQPVFPATAPLPPVAPSPRYPWGKRSREVQATLDPRLVRFTNAVAMHWNVSLIEGYRSDERQIKLFNAKKSKIRTGGKHNQMPSLAVDMAPYPIDWNDIDQFIRFTYYCKGLAAGMGIKVRNGADWDSDNDYSDHIFLDWVHWELID